MKAPYSQGTTGLRIIRHEHDLGFIRCGRCNAPLYSVREISDRQAGEVGA